MRRAINFSDNLRNATLRRLCFWRDVYRRVFSGFGHGLSGVCRYSVKKVSKKVETCLTFYHAGYSIIFYIQSIRLFHKRNELFVRSCLREGEVDLNRGARTRGVDAVFNFIARRFERIDENKVSRLVLVRHEVRTVFWGRDIRVRKPQLRDGTLKRKCFVSRHLARCVGVKLRPILEDVFRQVVGASIDFRSNYFLRPAKKVVRIRVAVMSVVRSYARLNRFWLMNNRICVF